ncbi:cation:proton antiporter [Actinokineospora diospyrosa]|uniref:Monovalent cation:H+ antiporter, CPA1 family n=1 Tax=Actinokineospora diospyrosa TaxID=103728 RepID=A0ABT1INB4_9PSEU|nr:sodium:proton antiporter [Actinokineospora diospyrosa]MCP2274165.1 monovalent cation:H+ antiporter, CPA1 family [Actinokineospora diospyrosa]
MNGVQLLLIIGFGIAVTAIARKKRVEPGWLIVVLAAGASFIPGVPRLELDSELILAHVIPPLLYSATRGASISGFGANLRAIIYLGVVTVVLTAGVLGWLASLLLPSIGVAAAFVLGSVLAPPDTITTVSHGAEMGMPKRVTSILTGESLVNDATALTLFTIAVAAVNGAHATWLGGFVEFFRTAGIGLAIGAGFALVGLVIRKRLGNPTLETALVMLLPFTAFLTAEQAHASGILAVVAAAFSMSVNLALDPRHQYPGGHRTRLQEDGVWQVMDFLLETFVFAYIGLQLRFVLHDLDVADDTAVARTLIAAGVLLVAAIVFRFVAVFGLFGRWKAHHQRAQRRLVRAPRFLPARDGRRKRGEPVAPPTTKESTLVGWTGMRGILTLAAAAGVPELTSAGEPFPGRDEVQAIALIVTLGTLLIQGTTISWLTRKLGFDLTAERAEYTRMRAHGRKIATAASLPEGDPDASFDAQRFAVGQAVMRRQLTEDVARDIVEEIDLRQAAHHIGR